MEASRRSFLRRIAIRVLALFALIAALGLLFTKVLDDVAPVANEDSVNRALAADRTATGNTVTSFFSTLASTPAIIAMLLITMLIFRIVYHRWRESAFLFLTVGTQTLVFLAVALVVARNRPDVKHLDPAPPTSSFPSGHTSAATALFVGIALVIGWHTGRASVRGLVVALALLVPIAVAYSRLYRGMHHPTDVLTSFVNGGLAIAIYARHVLFGVVPDAWKRLLDGPDHDLEPALDDPPGVRA
ncbi:MAG: phosphatase PAP2 family protein [Mycobacteriales bacterium]